MILKNIHSVEEVPLYSPMFAKDYFEPLGFCNPSSLEFGDGAAAVSGMQEQQFGFPEGLLPFPSLQAPQPWALHTKSEMTPVPESSPQACLQFLII